MTNNDAAYFILGNAAVQHQAERHQHPWQIRRRKDQETEEAQTSLGIAAGPDVD